MKASVSLSFIFAMALFGVATRTDAATLVNYAFGTSSTSLDTTGTVISGVTAGNISAGSGVSLNNSGVTLGGTSVPRALGLNGTGVSSSETFAIEANRFVTFTLTPSAGQQLTLERFSMRTNLGSASLAAALLAPEFSVQVNTGSGFTTAATGVITAVSGTTGSPNDVFDLALTPSVAGGFSNLTGTTTIRMVFYDTTTPAASWSDWVRMDDIAITGTIAPIPEAGSVMLGMLGGIAALARRKR